MIVKGTSIHSTHHTTYNSQIKQLGEAPLTWNSYSKSFSRVLLAQEISLASIPFIAPSKFSLLVL